MTSPRVNKHWLFWDSPNVDLKRDRQKFGTFIQPTLIVIHYAVTHSLDATVAAQNARDYWAHLSIDGYADEGPVYKVYQALPFNEMGSHAGASEWQGRDRCNGFSIGIEIANPGPLARDAQGNLRTVYGKLWEEYDALEAPHPSLPKNHPWQHWARYSDQEFDILIAVCRALVAAYPSIDSIAGHDEISPGRKFDPGPAFDISYLRSKVFSE